MELKPTGVFILPIVWLILFGMLGMIVVGGLVFVAVNRAEPQPPVNVRQAPSWMPTAHAAVPDESAEPVAAAARPQAKPVPKHLNFDDVIVSMRQGARYEGGSRISVLVDGDWFDDFTGTITDNWNDLFYRDGVLVAIRGRKR